ETPGAALSGVLLLGRVVSRPLKRSARAVETPEASMRRMHGLEPPPDAGHIVRAIRLKLRLTEEELAHALGISFSTVSRWETGHMKPSRLAWQALAQLAAERGCPLLVESSEDARGAPDRLPAPDYSRVRAPR